MRSCLLLVILLLTNTTLLAQSSSDEPLIPPLPQNNQPSESLQDPFAPRINDSGKLENPKLFDEATVSDEPVENSALQNLDTQKATTPPSLDQVNSNHGLENDPLAQELLHGDDADFKPAPLKIESEANNGEEPKKSPPPTPETPTENTSEQNQALEQDAISSNIPVPSPTSTATPTPSPTVEVTPTPSFLEPDSEIKTQDLIKEDIDPWDDPRKQVSTTCRLQLERIKRKKILFQRAEGTYLRIQEAYSTAQGSRAVQLKDIYIQLGKKTVELQKELTSLKEKAVRQGCPGVNF